MEEFKIDKDVPKPLKRSKGKKANYPFDKMEVGDSFFVSIKEGDNISKVQALVASSAKYYVLRNRLDVKFSTRTMVGGVRIWRIK